MDLYVPHAAGWVETTKYNRKPEEKLNIRERENLEQLNIRENTKIVHKILLEILNVKFETELGRRNVLFVHR